MRMFVDCEWNGYQGELLSVALVPESELLAPSWYVELPTPDNVDPWVRENVIPHMHGNKMSRSEVQSSLESYLHNFPSVYVVADWPEDIERLCELMIVGPGKRIHIPRLTFEVIPGLDAVSQMSEVPHHALSDARALKKLVIETEQAEALGC